MLPLVGNGATAFAYLNSWHDEGAGYTAGRYWMDALGVVHLAGTVNGGAGSSIIAQLPAGFRPTGNIILSSFVGGVGGSEVSIDSSGNVYAPPGTISLIQLDGMHFLPF